MRRAFPLVAASALAFAGLTSAFDARASAVAYPDGRYARIKRETAIVSWDAAHKRETLYLDLRIEGDAPSVAALVPTPHGATVQIASPGATPSGTLPRVLAFAKPPHTALDDEPLPIVEVAQVGTADVAGADPDAVKRWLEAHGFAAKQGLLDWAAVYAKRGWDLAVVDASRTEGTGRRVLALPEIAVTFTTEAPVVPYVDAEPDFAAHNAYLTRAGLCGADGGACTAPWDRSFDVYVAADAPARAARQDGVGPLLMQVMQAPPIVFQQIFAGEHPRFTAWTLTHFADASSTHQGTEDFVIATLETPPTRPVVAAHAPARRTHRPTHAQVLFGLVALLAALGVGVALKNGQDR